MTVQDIDLEASPSHKPRGDGAGTASVVRALRLLDVFMGAQSALGVSDIARLADVPTSTAHRLLSHLVQGELVSREGMNYRLSERVFELGNHVSHSRPQGIRDTAGPFMGELFGATGLTIHLAVLDGPQIIMVDKISGLRSHRSKAVVGGRYPTVCTALGKAMLAFEDEHYLHRVIASGLPPRTRYSITRPNELINQLANIRNSRVAFDREEATLGQTCMAAPILHEGRAVAALSASSGRAKDVEAPQLRALLVRTSAQLSARLRTTERPH